MKALTCPIFLFFCISAIVDKLNLRVKSKGHLVNKNLSFVTSENGVLSLPETWKISQNIKFCMNLIPKHQILHESHIQIIWFSIKKNMVVEFFFRKWWNSKSGQKLWFRFCWLIIFCSSEEPPATNAWVQFSVITSFKLLHRKGFYSANVPEMTQNIFNFKYFLFIAVFLHVSKSIFYSKGQGTPKVE